MTKPGKVLPLDQLPTRKPKAPKLSPDQVILRGIILTLSISLVVIISFMVAMSGWTPGVGASPDHKEVPTITNWDGAKK
jgi:hypothetical protein